ncbi:MAG TPA: hypothetical protein VFV38_22020 [Ktedonobacteraceae bacterium]|nr:hypothetical protein [Ktedonobacteraceae bacterium]
MKHAASSTKRGISFHRYSWRFLLAAGLVICFLTIVLLLGYAVPVRTFASTRTPQWNGFNSSPSQGPVGAVIAVTGANLRSTDGTKVQVGYTLNFMDCNAVADSRGGVITNHAFSGWFRWPTNTGTGVFGVCALVGSRTLFVSTYRVLTDAVPQVTVTPTTPGAGKQARVTGANFLPSGTSVNLVWRSVNGGQTLALGTVTSDSTGAFTSTFTVPARASSGSYTITATVGSSQPPTLSASKTFHVNGMTIVVVPTATARPSPTATLAVSPTATARSTPPGSIQPTHTNTSAGRPGMLMPIASGGLLLVMVALVAGVLVVRRQRSLVATPSTDGFSWAGSSATGPGGASSPGAASGPGAFAEQTVPNRPFMPHAVTAPVRGDVSAIPFDPALAEAMRQAQVSLFATPRPPVKEEVPS